MVFTGHEHSYERTFLLSNFEGQEVVSQSSQLDLSPGHSFAAVVGLGGDSIRPWRFGLEQNSWWAAKAALDNGVDYGALLCTLGLSTPSEYEEEDSPSRAGICYFKDINGVVWDNFTMTTPRSKVAPRMKEASMLKDQQYQERPLVQVQSSAATDTSSYLLPSSRKHRHHHHYSSFNSSMMPARSGILHSLTFCLSPRDLKAKQFFLQMMLVTSPRVPVTGSIRISVQRHDSSSSFTSSSIIQKVFELLSLQASSTSIWNTPFSTRKSVFTLVTIESGEVWVSPDLAPLQLSRFASTEDSLITFVVEASFPGQTFIHGITDALKTCAAPVLSVVS